MLTEWRPRPTAGPYFGTGGVGVMVPAFERYLLSIVVRIVAMSIPALCICIASRATSRHTPQLMPCASQRGLPSASRPETKQCSLCTWSLRSQPQKHGT